MTPEQRDNLKKLADYLATGRTHHRFDMSVFNDAANSPHRWECGTAACAVGHGPAAGIKPLPEEGWKRYCLRVFGVDFYSIDGRFDWLFGTKWECRDPTPEGAAARIRYFLKHGIPDWFLLGFNRETYWDTINANIR